MYFLIKGIILSIANGSQTKTNEIEAEPAPA